MTPLVLLTGFLGAGKTSFLRAMLPRLVAQNIPPVVILNDYQNAHVDALLLRELSFSIAPISGACVCCGSRDELMETLEALPLPPNAVLLLEANGTADTLELLEFLAADRRAMRFTLPVQINVVDARRWQQRHWNNGIELGQARTATFLSLTHRDEADDARWNEVRDALIALNPQARFTDLEQFTNEIIALARDAASQPDCRFISHAAATSHHSGHGEHHFAALEIPLTSPVHADALLKFLNELPIEVVRAKGVAILDTTPAESVLFQKVEGRGNASLMKLGSADGVRPTIIFIGPRLPEEELRQKVSALS